MNTTDTTALRAALTERDAARQKLSDATTILERAKATAAEAQAEADRRGAEQTQWIDRHSRKLSAWISGGGHGPPPVLAGDAKAMQAQATAKAAAVAAAQALAEFEASEAQLRQVLEAAERKVHELKLAALRSHLDTLVEQLKKMRSEEVSLCRLITLAEKHCGGLTQAAVFAFQNALARPVPENFVEGFGLVATIHDPIGGDRAANARAHEYWEELEAALERSGETDPEPGAAPTEVAA